jgi:hypothetical protein
MKDELIRAGSNHVVVGAEKGTLNKSAGLLLPITRCDGNGHGEEGGVLSRISAFSLRRLQPLYFIHGR